MSQNTLQIEIKKIILSNLQQSGQSIHTIIEDILNNLMLLSASEATNDSVLCTAAEYIFAYLQLGFSYLNHRELFDSVLSTAGCDREQIAALQTQNKQITLNKTQLHSLLGKWPASPHNSHNVTDAVNDILYRVQHNDYGTYYYYTAKKDGNYTALYQLTISADYILFCDVIHNNYYQLIKN